MKIMEKLKYLSSRHLIFISLFILFGVVIPIYYISYPLQVDEVTYLVIGDNIKEGSVLYQDVADVKSPGIYYLAALIFNIAGKSLISARILIYIINAASALLLLVLGTKIKDKNIGMTASILFLASVYLPLSHGYYYLAEPHAVFFILLSVLFFLRDGYRAKFLVGLILGVGILFQQTVILLFGVFFLYYLVRLRFQSNRTKEYITDSAKNIIVIFLGCAVPLLITFAYFFMIGAASEMLYYTIFILKDHSVPFTPQNLVIGLFSYLPIVLLSISMVLVIGYRFLKGKIVDDKYLLLSLWMILFSIRPLILFRLSHGALFALPSASLLAAILLSSLYQNLKRKNNSGQLKCFIVIALLVTVGISSGTNMYIVGFRGDIDDQIRSAHKVEQHVDGKVYFFPSNNVLFFFTNLTPGVTYLGTIFCTDLAEKIISDLQVNNVSYIVADRAVIDALEQGKIKFASKPHNIIYDYIKEHYQMLTEVLTTYGDYIIYKLKENI